MKLGWVGLAAAASFAAGHVAAVDGAGDDEAVCRYMGCVTSVASAHRVSAGTAEHDVLEQGRRPHAEAAPRGACNWLPAALGFGGMSAS